MSKFSAKISVAFFYFYRRNIENAQMFLTNDDENAFYNTDFLNRIFKISETLQNIFI